MVIDNEPSSYCESIYTIDLHECMCIMNVASYSEHFSHWRKKERLSLIGGNSRELNGKHASLYCFDTQQQTGSIELRAHAVTLIRCKKLHIIYEREHTATRYFDVHNCFLWPALIPPCWERSVLMKSDWYWEKGNKHQISNSLIRHVHSLSVCVLLCEWPMLYASPPFEFFRQVC